MRFAPQWGYFGPIAPEQPDTFDGQLIVLTRPSSF